jgi:hypothetical protein
MDSKAKWTRLGQLMESGANLVILLFRQAAETKEAVPLSPLTLHINPPYVEEKNRDRPLDMIEFMVSMQGRLLKENNFLLHYTNSINELKKRI